MPLYMCNAVKGTISDHAKQMIATDITDIHCNVTGAPRSFVHVFFFEDAPQLPINRKRIFLFANIRAGRTHAQKASLVQQMISSIERRASVAGKDILADISDVPAGWVMEGGDVLPEPGQETAWLAAHSSAVT